MIPSLFKILLGKKNPNRIEYRRIIGRTFSGGGAKYIIEGGYVLASTGTAILTEGALVPVVYKNNQPTVIVAHQWRRVQFHPVSPLAAGDMLSVTGGYADTTGHSILIFTSFAQGEFTVDLTTLFGAPVLADYDFVERSGVSVVFCQNNPAIVAASWINPAIDNDQYQERNFIVLRVLDDQGKFTPRVINGQAQTSVFQALTIPQATATMLDEFVRSETITIRTLTEQRHLIWQDAQWEIGVCYVAIPLSVSVVDPAILHVLEMSPVTEDFVYTFGPILRDDIFDEDESHRKPSNQMFCIETDGVPEVFMLLHGETALGVSPANVSVPRNVFNATTGAEEATSAYIFTPFSSGQIGGPLAYLLTNEFFCLWNATTNQIVASSFETNGFEEYTNYLAFSGFGGVFEPGEGDHFNIPTRKRDDCEDSTGAVGVFMEFFTITNDVTTQPDHVRGVGDFPNVITAGLRYVADFDTPYISEPWLSENEDRLPVQDGNLHVTEWRPAARYLIFPEFTVYGSNVLYSVGRWDRLPGDLTEGFLTAIDLTKMAYLQILNNQLQPIFKSGPPSSLTTHMLSYWTGSALVSFFTGIDSFTAEVRVLRVNQRYVVFAQLNNDVLGTYYLYDRESGIAAPLSAPTVTSKPPGVDGENLLASERRLLWVGSGKKRLLTVAYNLQQNTYAWSDSADIDGDPKGQYPLVKGRTAAILPLTLEDKT